MIYKIFFTISLLAFSIACKSKKEIPITSTQQKIENTSYWNVEDMNIESVSQYVSEYKVYRLQEDLFLRSIENDTLLLPDLNGNLNEFIMQKTQAMNPELAEKFPEIKTYRGTQINNPLCEARITFKNKQPNITVLCNNVTYFIKKTNKEDYYVLYDKQATENTLSE